MKSKRKKEKKNKILCDKVEIDRMMYKNILLYARKMYESL